MVDYDGTITPIVKYPRLAKMPNESRRPLRSLTACRKCVVAIVSGRNLKELRNVVRIPQAYYMGNHGLQIVGPGLSFVHSKARQISRTLPRLYRQLNERLRAVGGVLIEQKGMTISVHYRNVAASNVPRVLRIVREAAQARKELWITYGKRVVEIRPRVRWGKGFAVSWLMARLGTGFPLYFGDDLTDEDAFSALKGGISVLVSETKRHSRAKYYVKNVLEVQYALRFLLTSLSDQ
jgi:trehalose-phosphatase